MSSGKRTQARLAELMGMCTKKRVVFLPAFGGVRTLRVAYMHEGKLICSNHVYRGYLLDSRLGMGPGLYFVKSSLVLTLRKKKYLGKALQRVACPLHSITVYMAGKTPLPDLLAGWLEKRARKLRQTTAIVDKSPSSSQRR